MSKLIIEENPLVLLPSLAASIGLHEAIILQQLHYWINHTGPDGRKYGTIKDERRWIRNTVEQWQKENFPFLSTSQIYRAFENLEVIGLVSSRKDLNKAGFDRTKWYSIDYAILHQREMEFAQEENAFRAGEDTIPETTSKTTPDTLPAENLNLYQQLHNAFFTEAKLPINPNLKPRDNEALTEWVSLECTLEDIQAAVKYAVDNHLSIVSPASISNGVKIARGQRLRGQPQIETMEQKFEKAGYK